MGLSVSRVSAFVQVNQGASGKFSPRNGTDGAAIVPRTTLLDLFAKEATMTALPLTALITLMILLLVFATALNVGRARGKYGIKAPAVSGHEMFDRAFRVQMNTLESTVLMLPALWLCAAFYHDGRAALLGLVWLLARIWYAIGYMRDPARREGGFILAFVAFSGLWIGAIVAVLQLLLRA